MTTPVADRAAPETSGYPEFDQAFTHFLRALLRSRGRVSRDRGLELTWSQYHLLEALDGVGELGVARIAEAAGVAAATATRMLDGLTRDGVVERRRCTDDRRVVNVALTEHGRGLVQAKREAVAEKRREVYASLDPVERERVAGLLERLAEAIDET